MDLEELAARGMAVVGKKVLSFVERHLKNGKKPSKKEVEEFSKELVQIIINNTNTNTNTQTSTINHYHSNPVSEKELEKQRLQINELEKAIT